MHMMSIGNFTTTVSTQSVNVLHPIDTCVAKRMRTWHQYRVLIILKADTAYFDASRFLLSVFLALH